MATYLFDGSFEGFLTAVARARSAGGEPAGFVNEEPGQGDLFGGMIPVVTNEESAERIMAELSRRCGPAVLRTAHHAFLADERDGAPAVYRYLDLALRTGRNVRGMLCNPAVTEAQRLAQRVRSEAHRLKGFARFRQTADGFWYAALEPDHRCLSLIAPHFADRLGDQDWVLHDLRRGHAAVYWAPEREWALVGLEVRGIVAFSADEERVAGLWRRYFTRASVGERLNPRLQRSKLPLKYRKHLTELGKE